MKLYEALRLEAKQRKQREEDREFAWQVFTLLVAGGLAYVWLILLGVM